MLMALGPVVFSRVSNLETVEMDIDVVFARHDVVNSGPVYEATGSEGAVFTLGGSIHPEHFGVDGALTALEAAETQQLPLPLMRGDWRPLGWVVIQKLKRVDETLNHYGLGREIFFKVTLLKTRAPGASAIPQLLSLF